LPLYEYECSKCGHRVEKIENVSGPYLKKCPKCGRKVQQLPSAPAIQFKGSGWYVTDYARKASPGDSTKDAPSEGGDKAEAKESKESKESKQAAGEKDPKKPSAAKKEK